MDLANERASAVDPYEPPQSFVDALRIERLEHSRLGIASTILGGVAMLSLVAFVVGVVYCLVATGGGGGVAEAGEAASFAIVLLCLLSTAAALTGFALGCLSLFQSRRKRFTAVVGIVLNGSMLALFAGCLAVSAAFS